jgi:hypothetical protein
MHYIKNNFLKINKIIKKHFKNKSIATRVLNIHFNRKKKALFAVSFSKSS